MKLSIFTTTVLAIAAGHLWLTPDQKGDRLFGREKYAEAAEVYRDPMRVGVAWFRAGEFQKAEQSFARVSSADAEYNRGNCLIFQGKYDAAVKRFDRALELRPGWESAVGNRRIAEVRAEATRQEGGDMGDQEIGADKIVFDKTRKGGQDTEIDEAAAASDKTMQAMWLQRMQTRPADFLKAKFAWQLAMGEEEPE